MKIKSKINGQISNVRADIAREMVKLGVAELLEPDSADGVVHAGNETYRLPRAGDAVVPEPRFSVGLIRKGTSSFMAIILKIGNVERFFCGSPNAIHDRFETVGRNRREFCSALGFPVPVEIQKEYLEAWKRGPRGAYSFTDQGLLQMAASGNGGFITGTDTGPSNEKMAVLLRTANEQPRNEELDNLSRDDKAIIKEAKKKIAALENVEGQPSWFD